MSCSHPHLATYGSLNPETGKRALRFIPIHQRSYSEVKRIYGDDLFLIPCGHCPQCSYEYSKQWMCRLMCETVYHRTSCFLTLTYSNNFLPSDGNLKKEHLKEFISNFSEFFGYFPTFFACGEYGSEENTKRPHYHMILFGEDFSFDRHLLFVNQIKQNIYTSNVLAKLWPYGISSIGEVEPNSCAYVARYSLKKKIHLSMDTDEFVYMSKGIGKQYFLDNWRDIYTVDSIYLNKHKFPVPRYYDKLAEKFSNDNPELAALYVATRESRLKRIHAKEYEELIKRSVKAQELVFRQQYDEGFDRLIKQRRHQ